MEICLFSTVFYAILRLVSLSVIVHSATLVENGSNIEVENAAPCNHHGKMIDLCMSIT
jgi:hypothetical protein